MIPVVLHHRIAHVHAFTDGLTAPDSHRLARPEPNLPQYSTGYRTKDYHSMAKSDLETALERARRSTTAAATRPSRVGKKGMLIHSDPELSRRLKHLAVDEDKTLQQLGVEALEMLFASRSSA